MAQLATITGLGAKLVSAIADGNYTPSPSQREQLASALGVSKDDISWGHAIPVQHLRGNLTGQPVSLTFSADSRYAFSAVQSQDKIFVIPLASRKIDKIISAPAGSGPDPYLPLPALR